MILWALLWSCGRTDPELVAMGEALERFEEGKARLQAGDPEGARERFTAARGIRDDALLMAWEAHAMAEEGDIDGALGMLDQAVARSPAFSEAHYNRAALLARLGRPDEAGPALQVALANGAAKPLDVLEDPDFVPHLQHPAFLFLPRTALTVAVEPPPPVAFLGSEISLRLTVSGLVVPPYEVSGGLAGPLRLVSLLQDRVTTAEGPGLVLIWTWRVEGAGHISVGPLKLTAGRHTSEVAAIAVEASAPPDRGQPDAIPPAWALPMDKAAGLSGPGAQVVDGELRVWAGPRDRVTTTPQLGPSGRYETREAGASLWVVHVWPSGAQVEEVRIEAPDGSTVFVGAPARR